MILLGVCTGLTAALFQSGGYICSRIYMKRGGNAVGLMILAQLLIALFSIPLLALAWQPGFWGNWHWLLPLAGTALGTTGIWISWPIGWTIAAVCSIALYATVRWEKFHATV